MKKIVFIILILSVMANVKAQRTEDVVYLKNGSVIRGKVLEQSESAVKIQINGGSIFSYAADEVEKRTEELKYSDIIVKKSGINASVDAGLMFNLDNISVCANMEINYRLPFGLNAGIGVGIESVDGWRVPVLANLEYRLFNEQKFSPFAFIQPGYNLPISRYDYNSTSGGFAANCGIGIYSYVGSHCALKVSLGYSHRRSTEEYSYLYYYSGSYITEYQYNRVFFKVGFIFE